MRLRAIANRGAALALLGLLGLVALAPFTNAQAQGARKVSQTAVITMENGGEIKLEFFPEDAPKTVENFVTLAKKGFYDGTTFHRVIPGFMIQGGDPNTRDARGNRTNHGSGGPGYTIKAEFNDTSHKRGIVSMARTDDPNSAGSQFFIVVKDALYLDRHYTAFGQVIRGIEVADKIVSLPRDRNDNPNERIEISKVVVPTAQT